MDVKNTHSVTKTEISVFGRQALDAERQKSPSLADKVLIVVLLYMICILLGMCCPEIYVPVFMWEKYDHAYLFAFHSDIILTTVVRLKWGILPVTAVILNTGNFIYIVQICSTKILVFCLSFLVCALIQLCTQIMVASHRRYHMTLLPTGAISSSTNLVHVFYAPSFHVTMPPQSASPRDIPNCLHTDTSSPFSAGLSFFLFGKHHTST